MNESAIRKFSKEEFGELNQQHNILVVVGNGFDISLLNKFNKQPHTDYTSFFYFLKSISFNASNFFMKTMEEARIKSENAEAGESAFSNWSDFEALISYFLEEKLNTNQKPSEGEVEVLVNDLAEIRIQFSNYLSQIVSPDLLSKIDKEVKKSKWGYRSFSSFLADLPEYEYGRIKFPSRVYHYDLFNYNIMNLNFTPLLDNYLYLDHEQFDPRPYKGVDTNFSFRINPRNYSNKFFGGEDCRKMWWKNGEVDSKLEFRPNNKTKCSSYVNVEIFHPHGTQLVPRSLLFGADGLATDNLDPVRKLEKPYLSRANIRYDKMINESELFIIFGSSLGESDRWWWERILGAVKNGSEAIIYWYSASGGNDKDVTADEIKDRFISKFLVRQKSAKGKYKEEVEEKVRDRLFVVPYRDSDTLSFLGYKSEGFDPSETDVAKLPPLL